MTAASGSAKLAVEKAGGLVTTVYYNRLGLRALTKPHKFPLGLPRPATPPPRFVGRFDAVGTLSSPSVAVASRGFAASALSSR